MDHRVNVKALLLCVLALTGLPAGAQALLPFEAHYAWTLKGIAAGHSTLTLQHLDADRWRYASRSVASGLFRLIARGDITQDSQLRIVNGQVLPEQYRGDDGTSATNRDVDLHFDWRARRVTGVYEDAPVDMAIEPGVHDDMSIQIALMNELLRGQVPKSFRLVDSNITKEYAYSLVETVSLNTPLGMQRTQVYRSQKVGSASSVLYWCAPDLGYLPLKVERHDGHDKVEWALNITALTRPANSKP